MFVLASIAYLCPGNGAWPNRVSNPYATSFHRGVWPKSGASKNGPGRTLNVHRMLHPGNNRGAAATIVNAKTPIVLNLASSASDPLARVIDVSCDRCGGPCR